jgi:putative DNA methylase
MAHSEVFTRRNLPHWFVPDAAHFVTYRLHGTLPKAARDQLDARKNELASQRPRPGESQSHRRERIHKELFATYDQLLASDASVKWLADPRIAAMVRSNLYHHHGSKYQLLAYCIMPNHVHVLLLPLAGQASRLPHEGVSPARSRDSPANRSAGGSPAHRSALDQIGETADAGSPLSSIMHSLKSYTAHEANTILHRTGPFWQSESYDHWVRDEQELDRIVAYIANNPLEAGLVERLQDWFFCSAPAGYLAVGDAWGWLLRAGPPPPPGV